MSKAAAWVMKLGDSLFASVSQTELVHIINGADPVKVPKMPDYCDHVIIWNDNILPVVNLSRLLGHRESRSGYDVVAVTIYRDSNNEIQYGGMVLADSPVIEVVQNSQMCSLPDNNKELADIALSCFVSKEGREVPILDLSKIFSRDYSSEYLMRH